MESFTPHEAKLYQAPILGNGASVRFSESGYISSKIKDFGSKLKNGIVIGIDLQPEKSGEQILYGCMRSKKSGFLLTYDINNRNHFLKVHIQDDLERKLIAIAQLSSAASKRLLIGIDPLQNNIQIIEINLFSEKNLTITYSFQENPRDFSNFTEPIILSGAMIDGFRVGSFVGKTANLFIASKILTEDIINEFIKISQEDILIFKGNRSPKQRDLERRYLFLENLKKLRQWHMQPTISEYEALEASTLLYMWLFDYRHPILQEICDEISLQLSFPGTSEEGESYIDKILLLNPAFYQTGIQGVGSPHGHNWHPLSIFRNEMAFHVQGYSVSHESFVKLVRHKLGGSHYDPSDRKKWQRDLKAYSDQFTSGGVSAICSQMKMLIKAVVEAVDGCGIVKQLNISQMVNDSF